MNYSDIIGGVAGFLTTVAFIPQVIKVYKSRSAKDLSLAMFVIFCTGVTLWLIYGLEKQDMPIIVTNAATLSLASVLLFFKLTYKD